MKWYDCRVFRVAFSTGAVVAAVPAPTSRIRSAQGGNLRGIAIQTGAGGVVAIQRVGNAMLLVEQQFQRRTLPGEEGVVPGDAGFQILRQRLAPLALRARFLRLRNLAERNAAAPAFTFAD